MQGLHRRNLLVKMLVDMVMVNAWLVATDPGFGKPSRAASKRPTAHAMPVTSKKNAQVPLLQQE
jgi:hypothetical protein